MFLILIPVAVKYSSIKLIIGLGNPGKEYAKTWHNMGFLFIDKCKEKIEYQFSTINKKDYELTTFPSLDLQLLKPLKFMNKSGEVLKSLLKFKEINPDEILIVHDDLDIAFGDYKLQKGKFPKVHNGLKSIQDQTGQTDFYYLRLGIETRNAKKKANIKGEDHVLSRIPKSLNETLEEVFDKAIKEISDIIIPS